MKHVRGRKHLDSFVAILTSLSLVFLPSASLATAPGDAPPYFTYQGRLFNSTGTLPLTDSSADFKVDILSPTMNCVLYSEVQLNVPLNNGTFTLRIGDTVGGLKRSNAGNGFPDGNLDPGLTMHTVFDNSSTVPIRGADATNDNQMPDMGPTQFCAVAYTPAPNDVRYLRLTVNVPSGAGTTLNRKTLTPNQMLTSVPWAMSSQSLQGRTAGQFVWTGTIAAMTQANMEAMVSGGDIGTALHRHDIYAATNNTGTGTYDFGDADLYTTGKLGLGLDSTPEGDIEIEKTGNMNIRFTGDGTGTMGLEFYNGLTQKAKIEAADNDDKLNFYAGAGGPLMVLDASAGSPVVDVNSSMRITGALEVGSYDGAFTPEAALLGAMNGTTLGTIWFNDATDKLRYWNGAAARTVANLEDNQTFAGNNTFSGTSTFTNAPVMTALGATNGAVPFTSGGNGTLATDSTNLVWDDATNRLGVGIATPSSSIHMHTAGGANTGFQITSSAGGGTGTATTDGFLMGTEGANGQNAFIINQENGYLRFGTNNTERVRIAADGGFDYTGQAAPAVSTADHGVMYYDSGVDEFRISNSTGAFETIATLADLSGTVSGTTNRVSKFTSATTVGDSGITDDGTTVSTAEKVNISSAAADALVVDTNTLVVDAATDKVGIGTAAPGYKLTVTDTIHSSKPLALADGGEAGIARTDTKLLLYDGSAVNWAGIGVDTAGDVLYRTGTAGTNLFTMTAAGKFGVGTASPGSMISAQQTGADATLPITTYGQFSTGASIDLRNPDNTVNAHTGIWLGQGAAGWGSAIVGRGEGGGTGGSLDFYTSTGNAMSHRMVVTNTGNVGINVTVPVSRLEVSTADATANTMTARTVSASTNLSTDFNTLTLTNTDTTVNNYVKLGFNDNINGQNAVDLFGIFTDHGNDYGDFAIRTRSAAGMTEKMRVLSTGHVGIGVTGPTAKLHLPAGTTGAGTAPLKFEPTGATLMTTPENGTMEYDGTDFWLSNGTAAANRKKIIVGTGGGGGGSFLQQDGGNTMDSGAQLRADDGTVAAPGITFEQDTGRNSGLYLVGDNQIGIATNGAQRIQIDDTDTTVTGNVKLSGDLQSTLNGTFSIKDFAGASILSHTNAQAISLGSGAMNGTVSVEPAAGAAGIYNTLFISPNTTGVAANGDGARMIFRSKSSTTSSQNMASVESAWTDVTHASRSAYLSFSTVNNAAALSENMRIMPSGNVGINVTNPVAKLDIQSNVDTQPAMIARGHASMTTDLARWYDKAGALTYTVPNTGSYPAAGTDIITKDYLINAIAGQDSTVVTGDGTQANNRITYWTNATDYKVGGDANFTWDGAEFYLNRNARLGASSGTISSDVVATGDALILKSNNDITTGTVLKVQDAATDRLTIDGNGVMTINGTITNTGGQTDSERFGANTTIAGVRDTAVGKSAVAGSGGGADNVAVGYNATANLGLSTAVGSSSATTGGVSVGFNAVSINGVAVGNAASAQTNGIAIGNSASNTGGGDRNVAVGTSATTTSADGVSVGANTSSHAWSVALGASATATSVNSIAIGYGATVTAANQMVVGSNSSSIDNIYFGKGASNAAPTAFTINGTKSSANAVNGGDINIAGGIANQAADAGGNIALKTARLGAGQTLVDRLVINNDGALQMTGIANANAPAVSSANAGRIYYNSTDQKFKVSLNGAAYEDIATTGASAAFLKLDGTNSMSGNFNTADGDMVSSVADAAAATGFKFNTGTLDNATALAYDFQENGASRMVIDEDGKVGIGTSTPVSKLDVEGGAAIGATYSGTTAAPANGLIVEGNVGIGTTNPGAGLEVKGSGTGKVLIGQWPDSTDYGAISLGGSLPGAGYNFMSSPTDTNLYINRPATKSIQFREGNGTPAQMTILTGGNVGIGTTTPGTVNTIAGFGQFQIAAADAEAIIDGSTRSGIYYNRSSSAANSRLWWAGNTGNNFQIMSYNDNGGGGLGVMQLYRDGSRMNLNSSLAYSQINFTNTTSPHGYISYNGNDMQFFANNASTPTMTITGGAPGNVGIGTTAPGSKLDIHDNADNDNSVSVLNIKRSRSTGTDPAAGFGSKIVYQLQGQSDAQFADAGTIETVWENPQGNDTTDRDSSMKFNVMADNAALAPEGMVLTSTGRLKVREICDEANNNCKDLSAGWGVTPDLAESNPVMHADVTNNKLYFSLNPNFTADRTITFEDASMTMASTDTAQTISAVKTFSAMPRLTYATANRILFADGSKDQNTSNSLTFASATSSLGLGGAEAADARMKITNSTAAETALRVSLGHDTAIGMQVTANASGTATGKLTSWIGTNGTNETYVDSAGMIVTLDPTAAQNPVTRNYVATMLASALALNGTNNTVPKFSGNDIVDSGLTDDGTTFSTGRKVAFTSTATDALVVDTSTLVVDGTNNKVGIGVTAPGNALTVKPTAVDTGIEVRESDDGNTGALLAANASRGTLGLYENGTRNILLNSATGADSYINNGGNVGIGTAGPSQKLDVNGNIIIPNNSMYQTKKTDATTVGILMMDSSNNVTVGTSAAVDTSVWAGTGALRLSTSGGEKMTILNGGNVGIGTAAPASRLDSTGTIRAIDGAQVAPSSGSGLELLSTGGVGYVMAYNRTGAAYLPLHIGGSYTRIDNNGAEIMRVTGSNVGIGTSVPKEKLDVAGATAIAGTAVTAFSAQNASLAMVLDTSGSDGRITAASSGANNRNLNFRALNAGTANDGQLFLQYNGNVGIGTLSPGGALDIYRAASTNIYEDGVRTHRPGSFGQYAFMSYAPASSDAYFGSVYTGSAGVYGAIHFRQYTQGMTASDTMNIDTSRNVGIGTAAPSAKFHVTQPGIAAGNAYAVRATVVDSGGTPANSYGLFIDDMVDSTTGYEWAIYQNSTDDTNYFQGCVAIKGTEAEAYGCNGGTYALRVGGTGGSTGGWATISDIRLKKNITPLNGSLEKLMQIDGVYYDWRTDEYPGKGLLERHDMGVIAQNVEQFYPEAVHTDKEGFKSVNYPKLVAPVIEAIKELYNKLMDHDDKIDQLAQAVKSLQEENAELKARVEKLEKKK